MDIGHQNAGFPETGAFVRVPVDDAAPLVWFVITIPTFVGIESVPPESMVTFPVEILNENPAVPDFVKDNVLVELLNLKP